MQTVFISKKIALITSIVILLLLGGSGYLFYQNFIKSQTNSNQPQGEVAELINKIGQLVELPKGEVPTLATVTDKTKLSDQPFFAKAQVGDKVLIYIKAKKAVLYRPSINKVIEFAPINSSTSEATQSASSATPQPSASSNKIDQARINIRNGTRTSGLAAKIETQLKGEYPTLKSTTKGNADNDYETSVLVIINDQFKSAGDELAKFLKISTASLPKGEAAPKDIDLLILIGEDLI